MSLRALDSQPNNLPVQPTPFLGREKEVAAVTALLRREDVRLLTLTGAGGTGKTRMALQVAAEVSEAFPDGVFFVNLAPISDPELVIPSVAQVLDVKETGGHSLLDLLKAFLREKRLLLLLDNCEQVVRAGEQVAELLAACPRLTVLVTSRIALHVRAEHEFSVPPLALPDLKRLPDPVALARYEVVALFLQRAQAVKADFQVTSANAPAVAEICVRLDGLPLAIELAAARMKLLSPQALLARLGSRLQVLTGGARDAAERQQTLRNTIEWSYQLLDSQEQLLFRRLSVFAGGCTLEAVEAVDAAPGDIAEPALDSVASLVDKSLLQRMEQEAQEEPRFVMLETIREYGLERLEALGELEEGRKAHAAYFLALAEEAYLKTDSLEQSAWLRRLDREHDNLHAVISWALEQTGSEKEMALRLGIALRPFWDTRGYYSEGRDFLERALVGNDDAKSAVQAGALPTSRNGQMQWQAMMALGLLWTERDYAQAGTWFRRASDLAERLADPSLRARSLNRVGNWHLNVERPLEALTCHQEALNIFQELRDKPGIAETLDLLGMASYLGGDLIRGTAYYQQAIALFSELGDRQSLTSSLATLTMRGITYQTDTMIPAVTHVSEVIPDGQLALKIARETDQRAAEAYALIFLAFCLGPQGYYTQALEYAEQGLHIAEEIDHRQWMTAAHCALGALYRDLLALPLARQHLERALHLANETCSLHWIRTATGHLASTYVVTNDFLQAETVLQAILPPTTPAQTLGQRLVWCAHAELALAHKEPSQALQIIEQLMTPATQTGESRDILRLARLRGEALTVLNRASEAEELLQHAKKAAQQQGALPLLWRMHLALGKCYQTQRRYEAAEESFLAARDNLEQLAPHVPGESLRADFLEQTNHLLSVKSPSPKRAAKHSYVRPTTRERIEQELHTARLIQHSLLPEALPRLSGWRFATYYQPAREVGGDFYDFIPFEDGRLGLLIGDASGKGIPAALVMTTTCTMLRTAAQATASPGEVLAQVNDLLSARIPSGMFVTCFYALLDPRSERLRYANAGQDLPYRCHGNSASELRAAGMPLGLMPGSSYEEQEVIVAPGESILFYSDGLVEAHNASREMFGFPRLQTLLAEHADGTSLIDFLLGELKRFAGDGWEQEDDVTLLLLQRKAEPPSA